MLRSFTMRYVTKMACLGLLLILPGMGVSTAVHAANNAAPMQVTAPDDQLLLNSSFGNMSISPWVWLPATNNTCAWAVYTWAGWAQDGTAFLATNNPGGVCASFMQDVYMIPQVGDVYRYSIWTKTVNPDRRIGLTIWAIGGTQEVNQTSYNLPVSNWQCIETALTIKNTGHTRIRAEIYLQNPDSKDYFFDNAALRVNMGARCPVVPTPTPTSTSSPIPTQAPTIPLTPTVLPTSTPMPTLTAAPSDTPTLAVPASQTPMPTSTGTPQVRLQPIQPGPYAVGAPIAMQVVLENMADLWAVDLLCNVTDPSVLGGSSFDASGGGFATNAFVQDDGYQLDRWHVSLSLLGEQPALRGNLTAGTFTYRATASGSTQITCRAMLSERDGIDIPMSQIAPLTIEVAQPGTGTLHGSIVVEPETVPMPSVIMTLQGPVTISTTTTDGAFRFSNLPAGNYVIAAAADGFTSETIEIVVAEGEVVDASPLHLWAGDVTQDGQISLADLSVLATLLPETPVPPALVLADINRSGSVTIHDLAISAKNFGH